MNEKTLTLEQAYRAMYYFLENEFKFMSPNELDGLLSSMSWDITGGHGPGDPGAWEDWLAAVNEALSRNENAAPPPKPTPINLR